MREMSMRIGDIWESKGVFQCQDHSQVGLGVRVRVRLNVKLKFKAVPWVR